LLAVDHLVFVACMAWQLVDPVTGTTSDADGRQPSARELALGDVERNVPER
jgi:hypothetical protein